jgi:hypothetical protein
VLKLIFSTNYLEEVARLLQGATKSYIGSAGNPEVVAYFGSTQEPMSLHVFSATTASADTVSDRDLVGYVRGTAEFEVVRHIARAEFAAETRQYIPSCGVVLGRDRGS